MVYISKGTIKTGEPFSVLHAGNEYELSDEQKKLWLEGFNKERGYGNMETEDLRKPLEDLKNMGLAQVEREMKPRTLFRLLCRCVIMPVENIQTIYMTQTEKEIYEWITKSREILTAAELVAIKEAGISPEEKYLGDENYPALVSRIYQLMDLSCEDSLEYRMMFTESRDIVVSAVLGLAKKGAVILN